MAIDAMNILEQVVESFICVLCVTEEVSSFS